jgi:hypothetical protein
MKQSTTTFEVQDDGSVKAITTTILDGGDTIVKTHIFTADQFQKVVSDQQTVLNTLQPVATQVTTKVNNLKTPVQQVKI